MSSPLYIHMNKSSSDGVTWLSIRRVMASLPTARRGDEVSPDFKLVIFAPLRGSNNDKKNR